LPALAGIRGTCSRWLFKNFINNNLLNKQTNKRISHLLL
jgi:hypothetical protein